VSPGLMYLLNPEVTCSACPKNGSKINRYCKRLSRTSADHVVSLLAEPSITIVLDISWLVSRHTLREIARLSRLATPSFGCHICDLKSALPSKTSLADPL